MPRLERPAPFLLFSLLILGEFILYADGGASVSGASVSQPSVEVELKTEERGRVRWSVAESENFRLEMEENEKLAEATLQRVEGFYLLFLQEVPGLRQRPVHRQKLKLKIFKERGAYHDFCTANPADCGDSAGITLAAFQPRKGVYGTYVQNYVTFYWNSGEEHYFRTLFHELTHQLLNVHTQKDYPTWLTEGLAVYFGNTTLASRRLFVPEKFSNPYGNSVRAFLKKGGDPEAIFSWEGYEGADVTAYYGLAGSLVAFLMEDPRDRHVIEDLILGLRSGIPQEKLAASVFAGEKARVIEEWKHTLLSFASPPL